VPEKYIIQDLTADEKVKHPGKTVMLIETGYKQFPLGAYATKEEAEQSLKEWEARDELQEEISEFVDEKLAKYKGRLPDDEIRQMIKEA